MNDILIPLFWADSITIRLAIAPMIVAFPAKVVAEASPSHKISLPVSFHQRQHYYCQRHIAD